MRRVRMKSVLVHNAVRKIREELLMSKAELARNAGISRLTVDRVNYVSLLTPGKGGSFRKRKPFHPKGLQVAVGLPLVKIYFARTVRWGRKIGTY
jgi:hypothetical protein